MAIVWNYEPTGASVLEGLFNGLFNGNQVGGSPTSFTLLNGGHKVVFQGSFTYDGFNHVNGGTITGFGIYEGATLLATATGYSIGAAAFLNSLGVNADAFLQLFGSSMTVNGSILFDADLFAGRGDDIIHGNGGSDEIRANEGDDFVSGGESNDTMHGGEGSDIADYSEKSESVAVVLNGTEQVEVKIGGLVEDKIDGFENVIGGNGNDELTGDGLVNMLVGNAGDDRLLGMDGNDLLSGATGRDRVDGGRGNDQVVGGDGSDILRGGEDSDTFIFNTAFGPNNVDKIKDFSHIADTIMLIDEVFIGLAPGMLAKKFFHLGTKAGDGNDHIIYDKETGKVFYDADGKGGAKQVLFAKIEDGPKLMADDFLIG